MRGRRQQRDVDVASGRWRALRRGPELVHCHDVLEGAPQLRDDDLILAIGITSHGATF